MPSPLHTPVSQLKGVGSQTLSRLTRLKIITIADILSHIPRAYEDRRTVHPLSYLTHYPSGITCAIKANISQHSFIGSEKILKLHLSDDENGYAALLCFGRNFLAQQFPIGSSIYVWGQWLLRYGEIQASSFECEHIQNNAAPSWNGIRPIYPLTAGITQKILNNLIQQALMHYTNAIIEPLPPSLLTKHSLINKKNALHLLHNPRTPHDYQQANARFIYEELFCFQLALLYYTAQSKITRTTPQLPTTLQQAVWNSLAFTLTNSQTQALSEIMADMASETTMQRLLQGDVGCGKTIVALLSALPVIERGAQVIILVPTELLALQHYTNISALLEPHAIHTVLYTGSLKHAQKKAIQKDIADGTAHCIIATHIALGNTTDFARLEYIIIDEQHRFGVTQRERIRHKTTAPDILHMSATPIPRSIMLSIFGAIAISSITHIPKNRKPIKTHLATQAHAAKVYSAIKSELHAGRQAYFVYPLIEDEKNNPIKSAQQMYKTLTQFFAPHTLALIHSNIANDEKARIMEAFAHGSIQILIATTIIEVGINVPNATCIVIEHADYFGLAALHQLRGRVGRGNLQSYAFLIYSDAMSDIGKERMRIIKESLDGFYIAEQDLKLRGPGNIAGYEQSGFLHLRFADIARDAAIMDDAICDAHAILDADPKLEKPEHSMLHYIIEHWEQSWETKSFV